MAIPTIRDLTPYEPYTASAGQTEFEVPFSFYEDADLLVYQTESGNTPNDANDLLTLNVDYTVAGAGDTSGTITLVNAASAGDIIVIFRQTQIQKDSSYTDDFSAAQLNQDINKLYQIAQDLKTYFEKINPQYTNAGVKPANSLNLPQLSDGYIWKGASDDSIVAAELEENADCSTLRSDLAQNSSAGAAGANLVGYYDTGGLLETTVREKLDDLTTSSFPTESILQFGGDNTGTDDNTPAFNSALAYYAANTNNAILYFPPGEYLFNSKPNVVDINLTIIGQGSEITKIIQNYTEGTSTNALLQTASGETIQMRVLNLYGKISSGNSGGTFIGFESDASNRALNPVVDNVIIDSSDGQFSRGIQIMGENYANGIRYAYINNVNFNKGDDNASAYDLVLNNAHFSSINVTSRGTILISGLNASTESTDIELNCKNTNLTIELDYATRINIYTPYIKELTQSANTGRVNLYGWAQTKTIKDGNQVFFGAEDFKHNFSNDGYQKIGGGFILQWISNVTVNKGFSTPSTITLPTAFPNDNLGVFGSCELQSAAASSQAVVEIPGSRTTSTITVYNTGSAAEQFNILVIGY